MILSVLKLRSGLTQRSALSQRSVLCSFVAHFPDTLCLGRFRPGDRSIERMCRKACVLLCVCVSTPCVLTVDRLPISLCRSVVLAQTSAALCHRRGSEAKRLRLTEELMYCGHEASDRCGWSAGALVSETTRFRSVSWSVILS